jgi:hypothetical protein
MFKGFRLNSDFGLKIHSPHRERKKTVDLEAVKELILSGEPIDAQEVADNLFPGDSPNIFLSHSFKDKDKALKLAGILEEKNLSVFIDSEVWGSVYGLLRDIDNEYCFQAQTNTYSYEKRNQSTAHVYMILNTALHNMIDRAEAFLFIGSENSLVASAKDMTGLDDDQKTCSPWIHSELMISSMIRAKIPKRFQRRRTFIGKSETSMEQFDEARTLTVKHPAPVKHLKLIDQGTLNEWLETVRTGDGALDRLYSLTSEGVLTDV